MARLMKIHGSVFLILFLSTLTFTICVAQQPSDEQPISQVVHKLFEGMEKGDSAMVRSVFARQVTMATIRRDKNNAPSISHESSIAGFVKAVGTPHPEKWFEEIWGLEISVDGDFAQAWCDYAFYVGNKFSHCGVDAFQFYRTPTGWKIFHLADTRRASPCNIPEDIQAKHKP